MQMAVYCFGLYAMCTTVWLFTTVGIHATGVLNPTDSWFKMSLLTNFGLSAEFSVDNQTACKQYCTGNVSAVSYSRVHGKCVVSKCSNLVLSSNAIWDTYVCIAPVIVGCSYPRAQFEWLMTDACGTLNTGYQLPGLSMDPSNDLSPYAASYSVDLGNSGKAILYPGPANLVARTKPITSTFSFTKSFTFFGYFLLNTHVSSTTAAILEFGYQDNTGYYVNEQFWVDGGGLYYNFVFNNPTGYFNHKYDFSYPLNKWAHGALVYDSVAGTIAEYLNGTLMGSMSATIGIASPASNVVVTAARPTSVKNGGTYGQLSGSTACLKMFSVALTQSQIMDVAASCVFGQLIIN